MKRRANAGYLITDSTYVGDAEFVIGEMKTKFGTMYVTWQCRDGDNYFWGHYFSDRSAAEKDLQERVTREREYLAMKKEATQRARKCKKERER